MSKRLRRQRGAALLIVLLLVATLSFIVMSVSDRMILASSRSANARIRAELLWRVHGAETLTAAALGQAVKADGFKFAADNPFFSQAVEIPMESGGAVIAFSDAARCFNLNSFAKDGADEKTAEARLAELRRLLEFAGPEEADPARVSAVIADWIDKDNFESAQGAEDGVYAGLPAPYRTAAGAVADISELRALAGIDADAYRRIAPLVCALPATDPASLSINMLTEKDAALLAALAGDEVPLAAAEAAIQNRPVGGWDSADQFWSDPAFAGKNISDEAKTRVKLKSQFVQADIAIRFHDQSARARLLFAVSEQGDVRLVARSLAPAFQ
jgi:general secretion pathway protein K